ncbi:alpha/beta hydrolase [Ensifer soli]|uniref:alpha/beta hydrolase n=1 Tax=Ciceribacter sp. sgz301302 TaxID=3342379 RepID=UPI0035B8F15F
MSEPAFVHRFEPSPDGRGPTLVLMHGTGGNETSLLSFAREIVPNAALFAARGRSLDEGFPRWFRRKTAVTFDQAQIRSEAAAFSAFLVEAGRSYGFDPAAAVHLGYSNGANMIGAMMFLTPGLIRRAVLLRAMNILESVPAAELAGAAALMTTGARDPYSPYATALEANLLAAGAAVENVVVNAGHDLVMQDVALIRAWLGGQAPGKAMA